MLIYIMKHPNFDLMYRISFFSWIVFNEFIIKEGEYYAQNWYNSFLIGWFSEET
jgi:hypothetical protein